VENIRDKIPKEEENRIVLLGDFNVKLDNAPRPNSSIFSAKDFV